MLMNIPLSINATPMLRRFLQGALVLLLFFCFMPTASAQKTRILPPKRPVEKPAVKPKKEKPKAKPKAKPAPKPEPTVSAPTGNIAGHDYVDLGLPSGTKWAACNVGASSPADFGDYFAWGEITMKQRYTDLESATFGKNDIGDISGNPLMDVARAQWQEPWRMPTRAEWEELCDKCTWTQARHEGHDGQIVTGPNGKSIFLPEAGYWQDYTFFGDKKRAFYWSSTPASPDSAAKSAMMLCFHRSFYSVNRSSREYGFPVRPVTD